VCLSAPPRQIWLRDSADPRFRAVATDWADVYRKTYPDLVRFLHRKVWDPERARDLAQEVFVRALEHDPDDTRAWLFTIAANLARDEARSAIRRKQHLELLVTTIDRPEPPNPIERIEAAEQMKAVKAALARLSERDREVLLLWDAGLDYGQIASHTGLARTAVGTTLARARRKLVEAYDVGEGSHESLG